MARVVLEGLRKVYDNGHVAVADASFEVADGELLVLVGPSGCGKSTLLRMIAGLESISAGTLSIDGRMVNEVPPRDRDIAMVFQSYALYPHMSVAENLGFGLKLHGLAKAEIARRVAEAADLLGLETLLGRRPAALSGGQRQRVALGRALVRDPKVFLLDEPLSNLDAKLRHAMRVEIARLHRRLGATMLYVTHDQVEAMTLGQRIVVFKDGEIQQIDTPGKLYAEPANLFVATFLGSPEMNLLRGRLRRDGSVRLDLGAFALSLPGLDLSRSELAAWIDREVVAGVRPEHLHWPAAVDEAVLSGRVELVESIGPEQFVHVAADGIRAVARTASQPLPEAVVEFGFRPADVHFFEPSSGRRIG